MGRRNESEGAALVGRLTWWAPGVFWAFLDVWVPARQRGAQREVAVVRVLVAAWRRRRHDN